MYCTSNSIYIWPYECKICHNLFIKKNLRNFLLTGRRLVVVLDVRGHLDPGRQMAEDAELLGAHPLVTLGGQSGTLENLELRLSLSSFID